MFRSFNLGNILVVVGLAVLAVTFYVPIWSAERVARVEGRAEEVGRALLEVAQGIEGLDVTAPESAGLLLEGLRARWRELGQPDSDAPERVDADLPFPVFGIRHYLVRVARRPPAPNADPASDSTRPFDVYAWPRSTLPPGRTVFYFTGDGRPAYTRNLSAGYAGLDRVPPLGAAIPRDDPKRVRNADDYRSNDDERWIVLPADRGAAGSGQ